MVDHRTSLCGRFLILNCQKDSEAVGLIHYRMPLPQKSAISELLVSACRLAAVGTVQYIRTYTVAKHCRELVSDIMAFMIDDQTPDRWMNRSTDRSIATIVSDIEIQGETMSLADDPGAAREPSQRQLCYRPQTGDGGGKGLLGDA